MPESLSEQEDLCKKGRRRGEGKKERKKKKREGAIGRELEKCRRRNTRSKRGPQQRM